MLFRSEYTASIRDDPERNTMKWKNSRQVQISELARINIFTDWKEVSYLGETIDDNPYGIIALL